MKALDRFAVRLAQGLPQLHRRAQGQGFVEYLLIIGLVGLGLTAALIAFRGQLGDALSTVGAGL